MTQNRWNLAKKKRKISQNIWKSISDEKWQISKWTQNDQKEITMTCWVHLQLFRVLFKVKVFWEGRVFSVSALGPIFLLFRPRRRSLLQTKIIWMLRIYKKKLNLWWPKWKVSFLQGWAAGSDNIKTLVLQRCTAWRQCWTSFHWQNTPACLCDVRTVVQTVNQGT